MPSLLVVGFAAVVAQASKSIAPPATSKPRIQHAYYHSSHMPAKQGRTGRGECGAFLICKFKQDTRFVFFGSAVSILDLVFVRVLVRNVKATEDLLDENAFARFSVVALPRQWLNLAHWCDRWTFELSCV
jgi:hypothetical protein